MAMSIGSKKAVIYHCWTIFCGAIKEQCYADKPETIEHLKDKIREVFAEIRSHTLETVHANWSDPYEWNNIPFLNVITLVDTKKYNCQNLKPV